MCVIIPIFRTSHYSLVGLGCQVWRGRVLGGAGGWGLRKQKPFHRPDSPILCVHWLDLTITDEEWGSPRMNCTSCISTGVLFLFWRVCLLVLARGMMACVFIARAKAENLQKWSRSWKGTNSQTLASLCLSLDQCHFGWPSYQKSVPSSQIMPS